jgi:DNA-binding LacI/PurR family transcriptional regulator
VAKVRMEDIAKLAGVSLATVSRAIHSSHLLNPETRERILRVMDENNYVYNATAADLSRNRSTVVGVLIPTSRSPVFASTIFAIQEKCHEHGYSVLVGNTKYEADIERNLLKQFQERRVAGVILTGFSLGQTDAVTDMVRAGIPCVVIWEKLKDKRISYVGFDNFRAAESMTEYLIGLGHRRIGLIIGPFSKVGRVRKRLEGYLRALGRHRIQKDMSLVVETEPTLENGWEAMNGLLDLRRRPTAVFAASDVLAMGAMRGVRERGLGIPEDISVAGFDDMVFAAYCEPPLTTVRVANYEIGERAVEVLLEAVERDPCLVRQHCMDTELVIRGSCCKPKG